MRRGDAVFLGAMLGASALAFVLPGLREGRLLGVSYFGWWMAGLMFVVPLVALGRLVKR